MESPFDARAADGRLRLTFDDAALIGGSGTQADALDLIRGFATRGLVDGRGIAPAGIPYVVRNEADDQHHVHPLDDDPTVVGGEPGEAALSLSTIYGGNPQRPEAVALLDSFMRVRPHRTLRRDILVSLDEGLLGNRAHPLIEDLNVRTPGEAARIVGLHLRLRSDFTYRAWSSGSAQTSRRPFYQELAQCRLGPYWRLHFAATTAAGDARQAHDTHIHLSWSVISRIAQALQALDEVGFVYYGSSQGQDASERGLYHFNYGLLLLSGAVDAFVRLAQPLAGIHGRRPSLRNSDYVVRLERAEAPRIADHVRLPETQAVLYLLSELRNRIHEVQLQPRTAPDGGPGVVVPEEIAIPMWCAARQMHAFSDFGLTVRSWDRAIRNGVEDVDSARFEITIGLYPYLRSLTYSVSRLVGELAEQFAIVGQRRGALRLPATNRWEDSDQTRRRQAIELLG
jgi:hypothetical protein